MKIRDVALRAARSLRQAKTRTLLTSLAISVGAFTVTLALAAGAGSQSYTDSLLKSNGDAKNLTVLAKTNSDTDTPKEYGTGSSASQGLLGSDDITKISRLNGVADVTPAYNITAAYMTRNPDAKKYNTTLSIKTDRTTLPLAAGSLTNNQIPAGSVVIPEEYLGVLGFSSANAAIGQSLTLHIEKPAATLKDQPQAQDRTYTIAAVSKKTAAVLRYQANVQLSVQDGKAIYEYQTAGLAQNKQYASLQVRIGDTADGGAVQAAIKSAGYTVYSLQDIQKTLFQFINVIQWGVAGFGFLAILASVFGIINTQYISVLERTQQIGLMKALGARRKDIGRLFRYEAAWVGFLGGVIGTFFAVLTGLFNPLIAKSLNLEPGTNLLQFNPLTSIILIASLMLIAVIAGYFPSRKAARLDPIEALRTE